MRFPAYAHWRAHVPWTDDEIVVALRTAAAVDATRRWHNTRLAQAADVRRTGHLIASRHALHASAYARKQP